MTPFRHKAKIVLEQLQNKEIDIDQAVIEIADISNELAAKNEQHFIDFLDYVSLTLTEQTIKNSLNYDEKMVTDLFFSEEAKKKSIEYQNKIKPKIEQLFEQYNLTDEQKNEICIIIRYTTATISKIAESFKKSHKLN